MIRVPPLTLGKAFRDTSKLGLVALPGPDLALMITWQPGAEPMR